VIGHQQGFAKDGLAVAPGDFGEQIGFGTRDQILQGFQIFAEIFDTFVPRCGVGWSFGWRPVTLRPGGRFVFRVAAEFQDVPLGDAHVFKQHPG